MLTGLFEDASFRPSPNLHTSITLVEVYRFEHCLGWRFSSMYIFFSQGCLYPFSGAAQSFFLVPGSLTMLTGLFEGASFGPSPNLQTSIALMEVYRFEHCLGWGFSSMYIYFSQGCLWSFSDAAQSYFWCRDPQLCLLVFFKMLAHS